MRGSIALLALAAPVLTPAAALAEPAGAQSGPRIIVEGERTLCRRAIRTSSRMRTGRICRTQAEWRANGVTFSSSRGDIEDAQNALDMYAEKVSTNCVGGFFSGHETPLGPR